MNNDNRSPDLYWAAEKDDIASQINAKFDSYLLWLHTSGQGARIQRSYDQYYGFNKIGGYGLDSSDDILSHVTVPHYKNLLSRIHSMTVQAKLSFQPKAINSDSKTELQADLAKGLLEYENNDKDMGLVTSKMVEQSLVMFGSYVYAPWDKSKGAPIRPNAKGKMIFEGDQTFFNLSSFEVAKSTSEAKSPWYIVETRANRYDLIAEHPEHRDHILSMGSMINPYQLTTPYSNTGTEQDQDYVLIRTLLHDKTPALKTGRITVICGSEVLSDDVFTYKKMPVVYMSAASVMGEPGTADSPASSIIGLQEVLDKVYSAQVTNVLNGCVANLYTTDPNLTITQINKGQNLILASAPPTAVSLIGQSPEATNLINDIINQETLLSGLNNTAKGDPEASLKSGTSLSLVLSTAIQYIAPLQQSYARAVADIGTIVIKNLQTFCQVERTAFIAGVSGKSAAKAFKASDIIDIDRITIDLGNPVTQTMAGRMELLQTMIQMNAIPADKIDDFLRTGNLASLTEDAFSASIYVKEENEMLRRGKAPVAFIYDNHPAHIDDHLSLINSEEVRNNPEMLQMVLTHVQEHKDLWKSLPPEDAQMIVHIEPWPMPMPEQGPPPPDQGPPPPGGPGPQGNGPAPKVMGASLPTGNNIPEGFSEGYDEYSASMGDNPAAQVPE